MKYIDYRERKEQGTFNFPIAFYHQSQRSPKYHMQYHWHTHYEIIRVISGTFHLTLDNEIRILNPGDCVLITSGTLHGGVPYDCVYECIVPFTTSPHTKLQFSLFYRIIPPIYCQSSRNCAMHFPAKNRVMNLQPRDFCTCC